MNKGGSKTVWLARGPVEILCRLTAQFAKKKFQGSKFTTVRESVENKSHAHDHR